MNELLTRTITGAVLITVVIIATSYSLMTSIVLWTILTFLGERELRANKIGGPLAVIYLIAVSASLVGLGFFSFSDGTFQFDPKHYQGINGVAFLCVVWANDTFAYLGGMSIGRRLVSRGLAPQISHNKSWEGAIIGILVSSFIAFLFIDTIGILLGLAIGILATISDLIESKAKRKAGIKDTGSLLPGHGGILDRFDALLLTAPFTFVVIYFISQ